MTWADIEFLSLNCGDEDVSYHFSGDKVVSGGFECDDVGSESVRVLTSGKHFLEFRFGPNVAYAQNQAGHAVPEFSTVTLLLGALIAVAGIFAVRRRF